jgi:ATP-dependent Clp protease adaptor protein ClpS
MSSEHLDEDVDVVEKSTARTKKAKRFKVLLHNDDYTTMEFVISVLERIFFKSKEEAKEIMLTVHEKGVGICGVFVHEVAETKVKKVEILAKKEGFPLKATIEEE